MNDRVDHDTLDLVVLTLLEEGPMSAFDLIRRIQDARTAVAQLRHFTPGSLAPSMERLRRSGLVGAEPRALPGGVTRFHFALTRHGRLSLGLDQLAS